MDMFDTWDWSTRDSCGGKNSWNVRDFFKEKYGSSVWPSTDPDDSPYNTFTCKLCGFTFSERIFGDFNFGESGTENAEKRMEEHLMKYHLKEIRNKCNG